MSSPTVQILQGDALAQLKTLPDQSVHTCVTSPPYFALRNYQVAGQIGLELTPKVYLDRLLAVFREVHRVLRDDGSLWVVIGDSYASHSSGNAHTGLKALSDRYSPRKMPRERHCYQDGDMYLKRLVPRGLKPKDHRKHTGESEGWIR